MKSLLAKPVLTAICLFMGVSFAAFVRATPSMGAIAAGDQSSFVLKSDGTVWAWGANGAGQLGNGTWQSSQPVMTPGQVSGLAGVVDISSGMSHTLAVKADGTVWAWGDNSMGQLGVSIASYVPQQVVGLSDIVSAKAGLYCSVALKSDGTVWAWGDNSSGQLGDSTTTQRLAPVQVTGLSGVVAVATGNRQSLALKDDGTVWAWGWNGFGQLGDGTTITRLTPVQVSGLTQVVAIKTGGRRSLALKSDGTVWAWGWNIFGQLGDGTTIDRLTPVQVSGISDVVAIAGGGMHGLALKSDGSVWSWGANSWGELGDGTRVNRLIPVQVVGLSGVVAIDGAAWRGMALRADGSVYSWGDNDFSESGDGTRANCRYSPVQVTSFTDVQSVAVGVAMNDPHVLILRKDRTVWAWGSNLYGKLGDGTEVDGTSPAQVHNLTDIVSVAAGKRHGIALKSDGTVWTWGLNDAGQLGDGTFVNRSLPAQISLSGIIAIAAGTEHGMALKNDGTVWVWGWNNYGQLGDGTTTNRSTPVQVAGLSDVVAVAGGWGHSMVLKADGTVWAWGYNANGQLGDGTLVSRLSPQQVPGISGITSIVIDEGVSLALKSDGTVLAWGENYLGSSGNGTTSQYTASPVQVTGLGNVVQIALGGMTGLALKGDGTAWAWGACGSGQLGIGEPDPNATAQTVPIQVSNLSGVTALSGGHSTAFAILSDGTLRGWGSNACSIVTNAPVFNAVPVRAAIRAIVAVNDANQNGIDDAWEMLYFGSLSRSGVGDYDGDGLSDIQEFVRGTSPIESNADGDLLTDFVDAFPQDFYDGVVPVLSIISGDNQSALPGALNGNPFDVAVWKSDGSAPLVRAPVTFTVTSGGGLLALNSTTPAPLSALIVVNADEDGAAQVYYQQPALADVISDVTVTAGGASVTFSTNTLSPTADTDGNGLADRWELTYFRHLGNDPHASSFGDGLSNLYKFAMGLNPLVDEASNDKDGDGIANDQDARPNDPAVGRVGIVIDSPANGIVFE